MFSAHRSLALLATLVAADRANAQIFPCTFSYLAPAGLNPGASVIVDVNGDGRQDIVTNRIGGLAALLASPDGSYTPVLSPGQNTATNGGGLVAADFNGDGKIDILRSSYENDNPALARTVISFGVGDGTFGNETQFLTGNWATEVDAGDIDGDGDVDMVCGTEVNGFQVWKNNGNGTFGPRASYPCGTIMRQMELRDVSGDGRPDLVAINETTNQVSVLINSGSGTFPSRVTYATGSYPTGISVADFDGDGDRDIAFGHRNTLEVRLLRNTGNGTFSAWQTITNPLSAAIGVLVAGDYDGDGDVDLTCVSGYAGTAKWRHFINSSGNFLGGTMETSPATGWWAITGRVDADSRPDVMICEVNPPATGVTYRAFITTCPPCPEDLNGDGVVDGADLGRLLSAWGSCSNNP